MFPSIPASGVRLWWPTDAADKNTAGECSAAAIKPITHMSVLDSFITWAFIFILLKEYILCLFRIITASPLQLPQQHWLAERAAWPVTPILVRHPLMISLWAGCWDYWTVVMVIDWHLSLIDRHDKHDSSVVYCWWWFDMNACCTRKIKGSGMNRNHFWWRACCVASSS